MRKTILTVLAALALVPLGAAHATGVAVTIATPQFGLQIGGPLYAPPVYAPPVYFAPPVVAPMPIYAAPVVVAPRFVAGPAPIYSYVVPRKVRPHKHIHPAYRPVVPVVALPYGR